MGRSRDWGSESQNEGFVVSGLRLVLFGFGTKVVSGQGQEWQWIRSPQKNIRGVGLRGWAWHGLGFGTIQLSMSEV